MPFFKNDARHHKNDAKHDMFHPSSIFQEHREHNIAICSYLYNSNVNIANCWGGLGGGAWAASELLACLLEGSGLDAVVRVNSLRRLCMLRAIDQVQVTQLDIL